MTADSIHAQHLALAHFNASAAPVQSINAVGDADDGRISEACLQYLVKQGLRLEMQWPRPDTESLGASAAHEQGKPDHFK